MTSPPIDPREAPAELWAPLDDPAFWAGDPALHFARLRREAPVVWNPASRHWVLARHGDVMTVSRDPATFCSAQGVLAAEIGAARSSSPPTMMHTDPPEHSRYRTLVQPGFAPRVMRALEERIRTRAAALVDRLETGADVDFTATIAIPYPVAIIRELLGLDQVDDARMLRWSDAASTSATMTPEEIEAAREDQRTTLLAATVARRGTAADDLTAALANAEIDGDRLTDDEIVMFQNQFLVAGNETTRNMISGGMAALAARPEAWARLREEPALATTTVEEWLRWTSPVTSFLRTATRDTELGGVAIAAGEAVLMLYASANRDETVFGPTAEEFHVDRAPNPHVAFGFGPHFCLGAALARLEGRALLEALVARFAAVELAGDVVRTESSTVAGIRSLPLRFR